MKRLLIMAGAAAVLAMSSCTKEELVNDGPGVDGHRVSLTLNGSARMVGTQAVTRAASGGTVTGTLAALDKEKKVSSLLAVAFYRSSDENNGKLHKVFDVDMTGGNPNFDMESAGVFDVWFVANADETLAESIKGLTPETSTATDLNKLVGSQASDTDNQFLMVSVDSKEIRTNDGATTKVTVTMRRASARFDIINAIDGITVTKVKFKNRATNTQIATPNTTAEFTTAAFEDKDYDVNLVGNGKAAAEQDADNAKCEAKIYSYENVNDDENHKPTLELTYKVDVTGVERTHVVNFTDDIGDIQIKRNYLYRIILNEKHSDMTVACKLQVAEWNEAEEFEFEELPFDKNLNASLLVNRFAAKNVNADGLNSEESSFGFSTDNAVSNSAYAAFSADWATKKYTDEADVHGTQYRIPTVDEWMLLLPKKTEAESDCPYVCFEDSKMTASQFSESITVDETSVSGNSYLTYDNGDKAVYALRFMGSEQAAAYKYAFADNALSIKIIGLGKESKKEIGDVKSLDWATAENYIEVKLPANGYYASSDTDKASLQEENTKGYYWSVPAHDETADNAWAVTFDAQGAAVTSVTDKGAFYTLRPISDYDTPVLK